MRADEPKYEEAVVLNDTVLKDGSDLKPIRRGRWSGDGHCSECGDHALYWCLSSGYHRSPFCPNCGAEMENGRAVFTRRKSNYE